MTVGEKIKQQREIAGMSQDELARRMGFKDRSSISKIEKESDKNLSLEMIQRFADILECSPIYLMGLVEDQEEKTDKFTYLYSLLGKEEQTLVDNMILALSKK